jgi:hypothetical protein
MENEIEQRVAEAFNSMLRTEYISLDDVEKLNLLAEYYAGGADIAVYVASPRGAYIQTNVSATRR